MDHVEPVENGLQVEGILTVDILYATTDDSFPIAHTQEQIPFTQIVDVPGMKGTRKIFLMKSSRRLISLR